MLSPNKGLLSEAKKWVCFEPTVWPGTCCTVHRIRVLLQWTRYLIELVRDMLPLSDQRDNYHNRDLKPKLWDEIGDELNVTDKY
jgi:hypothetical protein